MRFRNISKEYQGSYLTYYRIGYETGSGNEKIYEMISRDPGIEAFEDLHGKSPDAVIMIIHDEGGERILLNFEYRMAVGEWVYNFPAGLIDEGETVTEAAARELREETGLTLTEIKEIWRESYSAVGFSNEKSSVVIGTAAGTIADSDSEAEEIKAAWFTKAQVRSLLAEYSFAARTQAYCSLWSRDSV